MARIVLGSVGPESLRERVMRQVVTVGADRNFAFALARPAGASNA
jgi:hypothetical protein